MTQISPPRVAATLIILMLAATACATSAAPTPSPTSRPSSTPEPSPAPSEDPAPSTPSPQPAIIGWEAATVPGSNNASAGVQIVPGGDGLVAIGFDGGFGSTLWTSSDGTTWTDVTPSGFESVGIVSVVEHDGMLVGVGRGNTVDVEAEEAAVYLSENGLDWRKVETAHQLVGQMIDVVATDDGLYAVGGVPGADAAGIWRSTDGETWERTGGDFEAAFMWAIAEGGSGLVAVGWRRTPDPSLAVWTSADGVEWTLAPDPEGFELFEATDVVATDDGTLVMIGSALDGRGGRIWTSDDGVSWDLADVAGGMDGTFARTVSITPAGLVAVGGSEAMEGHAWVSADGNAWEPLGDPLPNAYFQAVHPTDAGLLMIGATQSGTIDTGIEAHAQIWTAVLAD